MFDQEQLVLFAQRCLTVVGGFAAGYLFTWVAGVGFDKAVTRVKSPDFLHKWARRVGGVLVALVVAFLVFRGGPGSGGGSGKGEGDGEGSPATGSVAPQTSQTTPTDKRPEVVVDLSPVYVTVYAGDAVERGTEKFFAVGDPPGAKVDRAAVADAVRSAARDKGKVLVVYSLDDTATTATAGYRLLDAEAKLQGVGLVGKDEFSRLRQK